MPIPPAAKVTQEQMAEYRAAARQRVEEDRRALAGRRQRAWDVARRVAALLRRRFGVSHMAVFGSLLHEDRFTRWSDLDLAVWGLRPEETFRAMGVAMEADAEIQVNLVDVGTCRPSLLAVIEREGQDL